MYLTAFWGHKTPCSGANLKRSQAFYAGITDILKLRVLLSFLNEDPKTCTVTGLAGVLGEGKQKVSRIFMALEREGLLDRSDPRRPCLTEAGRARAACYEARTNVVLNHLLYEGLDIDSAMHDAYAWALIRSEHAFRLYTPAEELAISETICRWLLDNRHKRPLIDASVESGPLQTHDDDLRQDFAYTVILLTVEAA